MTGLSDTHPAPHAGWPLATSPYHAGEMEIQRRVGWRDRAEKTGRRVIRDFMTDQHRQFFAMLPYVFIGSLDAKRRPWASVLAAAPGFVSSSDPRRLEVRARPHPTDPAWSNLHVGCPIGLVGIEMHTRRRNRLTGRVTDMTDEGFAISVNQSFGNCPQYIQSRVSTHAESTQTNGKAIAMGAHLSPEAARIVTGADTLFIASASPQAGSDDPVEGVDCNHRGGKPRLCTPGGDIPAYRADRSRFLGQPRVQHVWQHPAQSCRRAFVRRLRQRRSRIAHGRRGDYLGGRRTGVVHRR
jgi:predicted pyridoxine 5'-phosphate oxidase superfamily flavin-nucleotide-binding protein